VRSNNNLLREVAEHIASGLRRSSLTTCSRWAIECRVLGKPFPGPWSFYRHPWLREMLDHDGDWVGKKSAQVGFTEAALNRVFFTMDIKRLDCLYVLPAKTPDGTDFSAGRFNSALELSPHLAKLFSSVKNVGHKRAGSTNLYIRGSRSTSGLKSIPAALLVLDEVEEMNKENISLAEERQSGQIDKQMIMISTPRVKGKGISSAFEGSTKESFFFICPSCSKLTTLIFPECIEIIGEHENDPRIHESYIKCKECKAKLPHEGKPDWLLTGRWIPERADRLIRGFYINQLYSSTVTPGEIIKLYFKAQKNPADEQEFYNSKLGLEHSVAGSSISDDDIDKCIATFKSGAIPRPSTIVTIGIDQGKWIHYEINEWILKYSNPSDPNSGAIPKVIERGKVLNFEDLDGLMHKYRANFGVIDGLPETRKALEFAYRWHGLIKLCYYGNGVAGKSIVQSKDEPKITVDRTTWLDLSLSRFRNGSIKLPVDVGYEYKNHIKALVRTFEKNDIGNAVASYTKADNDPDHFAHARNYSEIALVFAIGMGQSQNTRSPR
jgi:hypothetical protein